jgi:hypothetical protein
MRRLIFLPLVLVSTFALGLFVTFLLTFAGDALSRLLYEPSETIPALCRGAQGPESLPCARLYLQESEEAAVYAAVLDKTDIKMNGRPVVIAPEVVIQDQTLGGEPFLMNSAAHESLDRMFEALKRDFPLADRAALDSFRAMNDHPYLILEHPFLVRTRSRLISHQEVERFSRTTPGLWWDAFFREYPNAAGFYTLSKVGFNPELTQAIIYFDFSCGDTCGYGSYVLLVKEDGAWRPVGQAWQWIS